MTAKTALVQTRLRLLTGAAVFCVLMPAAVQASEGRYLNWQNKAAGQVSVQAAPPKNTVEFQGQSVPVPPSAYGQIGDPYARVLSWGTKNRAAEAMPQPVASATPANRAPVQATAPVSEPAPEPRRASNYRDTWPQYAPSPMASTLPEPVQPQPIYDDPAPQRAALPMVEAQVEQAPPQAPRPPSSRPAPAPVQAPLAQAAPPHPAARPAPQPAPLASVDGGYQVPATSKYASRIASAHAAQPQPAPVPQAAAAPVKPEKLAQSEKPTRPTPAKPAKDAKPAPADMPAPVTETATDDKPFVPGQHYTDASEAPRLYSLHRDYGLKPDPITVDSHATGAMLDTSKLDAMEAKAEKAESEAAGDAEPDDEAEVAKDTPTHKNSPSTKADKAAAKATPTP